MPPATKTEGAKKISMGQSPYTAFDCLVLAAVKRPLGLSLYTPVPVGRNTGPVSAGRPNIVVLSQLS